MLKKLVLETTAPFQGLAELVAYDEGLFEKEGLTIEWADREKGVDKTPQLHVTSHKDAPRFASHGKLLEEGKADILGLYLMSPGSIEHRNRRADRDEAEIARIRHWPQSWGPRPSPGGIFLKWDWRALGQCLVSGRWRSLATAARCLL